MELHYVFTGKGFGTGHEAEHDLVQPTAPAVGDPAVVHAVGQGAGEPFTVRDEQQAGEFQAVRPLTRTMPTPALPGAVATAAMVCGSGEEDIISSV
jgi:hypothetical protein